MPFLYKISWGKIKGKALLISRQEVASLVYHSIFDFPLTPRELIKWSVGNKVNLDAWREKEVDFKNGYYFLKGNEGTVYKRILKKRISQRKIALAKNAARILSLIPTTKMVALTGALAMENATEESDIDLLIITQKGRLWITRLMTLVTLTFLRIPIRRFGNKDQKDKLCLNMWLDEQALVWPWRDRNIYTAHEICQIKPLLNKDKTYEKFLAKNKWILDFWPNSIKILSEKDIKKLSTENKNFISQYLYSFISVLERLAFRLQYLYMKRKISREIVTPQKAIFHPNDWGKLVLEQLTS